jgi:putative transposase
MSPWELLGKHTNGDIFRRYKTEWMPKSGYINFNEAAQLITRYIVNYYNKYRPHQFSKDLSPQAVELEYQKTYKKVTCIS